MLGHVDKLLKIPGSMILSQSATIRPEQKAQLQTLSFQLIMSTISQFYVDEDLLYTSAGARLAFGGKPLEGHSIPQQYGAIVPTAVFVPLQEILKDGNFELVTTEVFGPVQARSRHSRKCV